ncbi:MAG TPA: hypothetical protein VF486_09880, partial [Actinomycetes bacterium]
APAAEVPAPTAGGVPAPGASEAPLPAAGATPAAAEDKAPAPAGGSGGLESEAGTTAAGRHLEPSGSPPVNRAAAPPATGQPLKAGGLVATVVVGRLKALLAAIGRFFRRLLGRS